jgi:hypothetical protein
MDFVVVVDPSGDVPEHGLGVRQWFYTNIITFEGFDEGLGDAVRFRAAHRGEARHQVQCRGEVPGLLGRVGAAVV